MAVPRTKQRDSRGTYLLQIAVEQTLMVSFGRLLQGQPIAVPAGHYVYVGSAQGKKGGSTLQSRLLRHARRSTGRPHHRLYAPLQRYFFPACSPGTHVISAPKRLRWHIDYLLDEYAVELQAVYVVYAAQHLEQDIAAILLADPLVSVLVPGLGASDASGTHLLRAPIDAGWWEGLPARLRVVIDAAPLDCVRINMV